MEDKDFAAEYVNAKLKILRKGLDNKELVEHDYEEEYVQINGIKQYFLHFPAQSDSVVLFLHGGPGYAIAYYGYKFKPKDKAFNLVFYDQRGAGKTQLKNHSTADEVNFEVLLQDLYETIAYLRVKYPGKRILLLGHSWGSTLGIEYVRRHMDTVDAYIGCGQVVDFKKEEMRAKEHLHKVISELGDEDGLTELAVCGDYPWNLEPETAMNEIQRFRLLQMRFGDSGFRGGDELTEIMLTNSPIFGEEDMDILQNYLYVNAHLIGETLASYSVEDFKKYSIPIYFVQGENDYQTTTSYVEDYFEVLDAPDKKFYCLKDTGHLLYLEEPDLYNDMIREICKRVEKCYAK